MADLWPNYTREELFEVQKKGRKPWHDNYLVMFSSVWGGFSTDPHLWGVPPDDHMVHRGDAVFEAFKVIDGRAYCLKEHLARFLNSASFLGLELPPEFDRIEDILKQAYRLGGHEDFVARLTVSRGPGSFSVNPYDSFGSQLYLITMKFKKPSPEVYERGVKLSTAPFPAKSEFPGIKTCDYLHNVLAKKSAIDAGADYVVSFDQDGNLTEGATENVAVVTVDGQLVVPPFSKILKGVTLLRAMELASQLGAPLLPKGVINKDLKRSELPNIAAEVFLTTTSFNVLAVTSWDNRPVGSGRPGPVTTELKRLIEAELSSDGPHTTALG
ncbi:MAG: aminotransferase class IV [Deltaproteobacteria bacterium]|jgi:branched-chain amino acid aminotransferase|nr:aminotransferase class IV [Deltaproteobacteria bacterium]